MTLEKKESTLSWPDGRGYFGAYGGQFVPETLVPALRELELMYESARNDPAFQEEYLRLLNDFAGRPTPLTFAGRLTGHYGRGKVYLKREDLCHTGAHKINNTVGQILLAMRSGKKRIIAETGAGQHGVATATVAAKMGLECCVYMGEEDVARQQLNVRRMEMLGATVVTVRSGSRTLKDATKLMDNTLGVFRIVHGKGTGALCRQVHAVLARLPEVRSFALAGEAGGGWGATLVTLRPAG